MNSTPQVTQKSCCGDDCCSAETNNPADAHQLREQVREGYGKIARSHSDNAFGLSQIGSQDSGCCGSTKISAQQVAGVVGYSAHDLAAIPAGSNMGLSCGNPTAIAALRDGETVLDLGSGGGFDCFVAGPRVGPTGCVIGVDMTTEMMDKARRGLSSYSQNTGLNNVEFRLGEIENLPVADASIDVVISNCVINLSPDKPRVWSEIARVLKPGGRVAVSDLALLRPLPPSIRETIETWIGCVAGAVLVDETRRWMESVGLTDISLTAKGQYIDSMADWQDPLYRKIADSLPPGLKPSDFITSLDISARKPTR